MTSESELREVLRELMEIADMVENSTDRAHWERLYRAIDAARRLLEAAQ